MYIILEINGGEVQIADSPKFDSPEAALHWIVDNIDEEWHEVYYVVQAWQLRK